MFGKRTPEIFYINERSQTASEELAQVLKYCILQAGRDFCEVVFLCIGSDRITGDSLGPLIGHRLSAYRALGFYVYGTLDDPVHALNLTDRLRMIRHRHPNGLIVAIDASLGSRRHQGYITVGCGPIRPGAGAGKNLPEVGDVFITGIVNVSGSFEQLLLQTTRLSTVFHMAEAITQGILIGFQTLEAAALAAVPAVAGAAAVSEQELL